MLSNGIAKSQNEKDPRPPEKNVLRPVLIYSDERHCQANIEETGV
jgi:hypothetical protein